ncbi:hypothetical protein [Marinobacter segnicrescens]|uniref:hypothetical protein n=1 Tax=Marinobacter segnicrescens TaxID=430453 RepID=UPI003A8E0F98
MDIRTLTVIVTMSIFISGCQAWQPDNMPPPAALPSYSETGVVEARYWSNVGGSGVSRLTSLATYPDDPDERVKLNELRSPQNRGDNYGSLVRGFIIPPTDGPYRFYATGDEETQFLLSTNERPENLNMIALVPEAARPDDYDRYRSQSSGTIDLAGGNRYYFEIRHKESTGSDHFNVAWEGPGFQRRVVGGEAIASLGESRGGIVAGDDAEAAYGLGYRVGFFDATQGGSFSPAYPPLDRDQDGIYDNWETSHGLSPADPSDATSDIDQDLLSAVDEFWIGSDPNNPDSDGDGIPDGAEFAYRLDPLNPGDARSDRDGDGISNLEEYRRGMDLDETLPSGPTAEAPPRAVNSVTVSWIAPLTRTDGSSMSLGEIDHYEIFYGQRQENMDLSISAPGDATSTEITGLEEGTWFFSIRVIDTSGAESALSEPVRHTIE